jgi:hypothetical protein
MDKLTLINPFIHQDAKLKKDIFLDRIKNVQYLRTRDFVSEFLIGDSYQWDFLTSLHEAINKQVFNFNFSDRLFAFKIKKEFYDWFKNNSIQTIQKQIINWTAAVYLSNHDRRDFFENEIYGVVLNEVKNVIKNYYKVDINESYDNSQNLYEEVSLEYINCLPPKFLRNPFLSTFLDRVIHFSDYWPISVPSIKVEIAYFTQTDWVCIVERDQTKFLQMNKGNLERGLMKQADVLRILKESESDDLQRAESKREIFDEWLYAYKNYDKLQTHIYKLFDDSITGGLIYLIRQRNSNNFKVGWTEKKPGLTEKQCVENRISGLQTGNPEPLDIVGFFRASSQRTEKAIHEKFDDKRKTGEWFFLTDNDCINILSDDWRVANNIF